MQGILRYPTGVLSIGLQGGTLFTLVEFASINIGSYELENESKGFGWQQEAEI